MHVHRTGVSFTVHSHGSSYATCTYTGCPEVDSLQLAWMQCPSAWIRSTQSNQSERVKKGIFKCSIPAHMHGSIAGRIRRPGPQPHSTHGARLRVFSFLSFLLVWWIICLWKPHSTFCLAGLHVIHASLSWLNCVKPYCSVWRLASLFLYFVAKQSLDKLHKKKIELGRITKNYGYKVTVKILC
jgi:hypothetical protein